MASCDNAKMTRSGKRKLAAVSNERVKNKDKEENMHHPKRVNTTHSTSSRTDTEMCFYHQSEPISTFCLTHGQLCCQLCLAVCHPYCDTESMSSLVDKLIHSDDLTTLSGKAKTLHDTYAEYLQRAESKVSAIHASHERENDGVKMSRKISGKTKTKTKNKSVQVKAVDFKQFEYVAKTCRAVTGQLDGMRTELDTLQESQNKEQLFIAMKKIENQLQLIEANLDKLRESIEIGEGTFITTEQLADTLEENKCKEKLDKPEKAKSFEKHTSKQSKSPKASKSMKAQKSRKSSKSPKSSNLPNAPKYVKDIFTQSNSDAPNGCASSILILSSNQILIADHFQNNVKVINTEQDRVVSELKLPGAWGITRMSENVVMDIESASDEFAVTTDRNKTIQFMNVSAEAIVKGREIEVESWVRGIAYNDRNQTLIVTLFKPTKLQILTLDGTVIRNIENEWTNVHGPERWLFIFPEYVILNQDRTGFYVSDASSSSVTLMTLDGQVEHVYKDSSLINPRGLVLRQTGFLYVADSSSHFVFKLEPGSSKFEPILDKSHGFYSPFGIAYCDQDNKIYIGSNNKIKVFKMK